VVNTLLYIFQTVVLPNPLFKTSLSLLRYNLKDGLGIKTLTANHTFGNDFSVISTLEESLSKASKLERVKFYREAPYIYHYFSDEYQMVTLLIAKYLYLDGFIRESKILNFELEQNIKSKKYLGARKVMLEKSKN
jgi:hypothetical protein